jgi:hypothetical protein
MKNILIKGEGPWQEQPHKLYNGWLHPPVDPQVVTTHIPSNNLSTVYTTPVEKPGPEFL